MAVTHPPSGCGGSTPSRRTDNLARSSNGSGYETLILVIRVRLPYGLLTPSAATCLHGVKRWQHSQVAEQVYARRSERRARKGMRVQLSPWLLSFAGGQAPNQLSCGRCARLDTGTCNLLRVGQCSFGPHKPERPGATPGPATYGRVRKQAKRSPTNATRRCPERGDFAGSTPASVTE